MSDSDSDTPCDINELGLPSITVAEKEGLENGHAKEESKGEDSKDKTQNSYKKSEKFNKFRNEAKDLVSKTDKQKLLYLSNSEIPKSGESSATLDSATGIPENLEINDPRFKYDIILSKGYRLFKKMGNGAYASVFLGEKVSDPGNK